MCFPRGGGMAIAACPRAARKQNGAFTAQQYLDAPKKRLPTCWPTT